MTRPTEAAREEAERVIVELREEARVRHQVAWGRSDGGQEWTLSALLADKAADTIEALLRAPSEAGGVDAVAVNKAEAILRRVRKFIAAEDKHARLSEAGKDTTRDDVDFEHSLLVGFTVAEVDAAIRLVRRRAASLSPAAAPGSEAGGEAVREAAEDLCIAIERDIPSWQSFSVRTHLSRLREALSEAALAKPSPAGGDVREALETAERLNARAKRGKADGRVFIDYRDWEAFMAEVRAALSSPATPEPAQTAEDFECPACVGTGLVESMNAGHPDYGFKKCSACGGSGSETPEPALAGGVRVKALLWEGQYLCPQVHHSANGHPFHYTIYDQRPHQAVRFSERFRLNGTNFEHGKNFSTIEAAKAAAQADYEARILAAIDPGQKMGERS